jgi:hypothetical protein
VWAASPHVARCRARRELTCACPILGARNDRDVVDVATELASQSVIRDRGCLCKRYAGPPPPERGLGWVTADNTPRGNGHRALVGAEVYEVYVVGIMES